MIYTWFFVFNIQEFIETEFQSQTYTMILQNIGEVEISVFKGNIYGFVYDDVYLKLTAETINAKTEDGLASYQDEFGNVFLGVEVES